MRPPHRRNREAPRDVERDTEIWTERTRRLDAHHRPEHLRLELLVPTETADRNAAGEPRTLKSDTTPPANRSGG
jgi:hypothetical protein